MVTFIQFVDRFLPILSVAYELHHPYSNTQLLACQLRALDAIRNFLECDVPREVR